MVRRSYIGRQVSKTDERSEGEVQNLARRKFLVGPGCQQAPTSTSWRRWRRRERLIDDR